MEKNTVSQRGRMNANLANNLDYSKGELEYKNIKLPQTIFTAKWQKGVGYSVGIVDAKLTEDFETLEEALNEVGLGVKIDKDGDEILELHQVGGVDYDLIARITAVLIEQFDKMKIKEVL